MTRALFEGGLVALAAFAGTMPAASQGPSAPPAVVAPPSAPVAQALVEGEESLRARAAKFWAARIAGDSKAQWELLEPRGRGRIAAADYAQGRGPVKYLAYQIEEANVNGYFAIVKVRLLVQPIIPALRSQAIGPEVVVAEDGWVRIQGTWYRSLEQGQPQGAEGAPR